MNNTILPTEITIDSDNNKQVASFPYYDGVHVAKQKGLQQTTSFSLVFAGTHFLVCCGDVMILTNEEEYKEIERRTI